jgi:2-haloalkanoic acid dehalogenase type II
MREKKAILLDFYGTVVYEDDKVIDSICQKIKESANCQASKSEIGTYWWDCFYELVSNSFGGKFETQRILELKSLEDTIKYFQAEINPSEESQLLFDYWTRPDIFPDAKEFLEKTDVPVCIVSNIDREDILRAIDYHNLKIEYLVASEEARSYKPRPELFKMALDRLSLTPDEAVHVGDSLVSDVFGAQNLGIKAVWVNRKNKTRKNDIVPDKECINLLELLNVKL